MDIVNNKFKQIYVYLNVLMNIICYVGLATCLIVGSGSTILWMLLAYLIIGINEQAFFHRMYTHRSWDCPEVFKTIGLLISTLSLLGPVIYWVALHRAHHRYNDTSKDPHSPLYMSNFKIQFLSSSLKIDIRNAADLMKNRKCIFFTVYYFEIIFFTWAILMFLMGPLNFFLIILGGTGLALITANSINTWHHGQQYYFGQYQNNKIGTDTSKNDIITGYLTFDGWHNNHHHDPKSFDFGTGISHNKFEFDLCRIFLPFLGKQQA